jgi:hypothetical protein
VKQLPQIHTNRTTKTSSTTMRSNSHDPCMDPCNKVSESQQNDGSKQQDHPTYNPHERIEKDPTNPLKVVGSSSPDDALHKQRASTPPPLSSTPSGTTPGAYRVLPLHVREDSLSSSSVDGMSSCHDSNRHVSMDPHTDTTTVLPVLSADLFDTHDRSVQDIMLVEAHVMPRSGRRWCGWILVSILLLMGVISASVITVFALRRSDSTSAVQVPRRDMPPRMQSYHIVAYQSTFATHINSNNSDCPSLVSPEQVVLTCLSGNALNLISSSRGWYCGDTESTAASHSTTCIRPDSKNNGPFLGQDVWNHRPMDTTTNTTTALYTSVFVLTCSGFNDSAGMAMTILPRNVSGCVSDATPPLYWTSLLSFCDASNDTVNIQYQASSYSGCQQVVLNDSSQVFYYQPTPCAPSSPPLCSTINASNDCSVSDNACFATSNTTYLNAVVDASLCLPPSQPKVMQGSFYFFDQLQLQGFLIPNIWAAMDSLH